MNYSRIQCLCFVNLFIIICYHCVKQENMKNLKINNKKKEEEEDDDDDEVEDGEEDDEPDDDEEEIELSPEVTARVRALRKLHDDVEGIDAEYKAERIQLEAKYKDKRSILYEARKNLVTGLVEAEDNTATGKYLCYF